MHITSEKFGVQADNNGTIEECRNHGFELLEQKQNFLENKVYLGSYDEEWSLRKVLRRFIWHDRIHAKAMYRMALKTFGKDAVPNDFFFLCRERVESSSEVKEVHIDEISRFIIRS